jgi:hypothetical protein
MTPVYEIFTNDAVVVNNTEILHPIENPEIQLDNREWITPYDWQTEMLKNIRSQSYNTGYKICKFKHNQQHNGFIYNAVCIDGDVFIVNLNTYKVRKFRFTFPEIEN